MRVSDMYPSRFLKAEDFEEGKTFILTAKDVQMEELGQGAKKETKPVMYFVETEKALVLNKTNANVIAQHLGDDTDGWVGKKIAFTTIDVDSFGEMVRAIRVKTRQSAPPKAPPVPVVDDDSEPFADEPAEPISVGNLGPGVKIPSKQKQTA